MKSESAQLRAGIIITYITIFVSNVIPLFYTPFVIGKLGLEEYGVYSLAKSFTLYLGLFNLGVGQAVPKFVNQAVAEKDFKARDNVFKIFTCIYLVISLAVLLCGGALSIYSGRLFGAIPSDLDTTLQLLIGLVTLNTAMGMFGGLYTAVIQSHHKFVFPKILGALMGVAAPALSALFLWFGYRSIAMMCIAVFLTLFFGVAQIFYVHKVLGVKFSFGKIDWGSLRNVFHFSKYIFLGAVASVLYDATDKVILGVYANAQAIAVYSVGAMLSMYSATLARGVSDLLFPKINTMLARGAVNSELDTLMLKVGRLQYIILGYILCGFILLGDHFIFLWVGDDFKSAYWIALLIMVPMSIPRLQSCGVSFLIAMNRHGFRASIFFLIAVLNVAGSLWAVQQWGAIGCAAVTGISGLVGSGLIMNVYYRMKIGLDIATFWKGIINMSFAFIVILAGGLVLKPYLTIDRWSSLLIAGSCYTAFYFLLLWFRGLNLYEKNLIIGLAAKVTSRLR